jgi:hypothetical protein
MTILSQYECELEIVMPHLAFRQGTEPHMESMLRRRIPEYGSVDCLPLWFYFYIESIRDPLTIIQHPDLDVELHPGNNRFIGRALRGDRPWVPARIITIHNPWRGGLTGIRNEKLLSTLEIDYTRKDDFYSNTALNAWSFGGYAPGANNWLQTDELVVSKWLGDQGGVLVLNNGNRHYVNRSASKKIEVRVKNHTGLYGAAQHLFKQLELKIQQQAESDKQFKARAKQLKRDLKRSRRA